MGAKIASFIVLVLKMRQRVREMQERLGKRMQEEPQLNENLNIPNPDHVRDLLRTAGTPVYDNEGNKVGTVSDRTEAGMLVIHRNRMASERELVVPLSIVAGADDKALYLLYHQDELAGYHKAAMHHQQPLTTGSTLAEQARPPKEEIQPQVRREDSTEQGDPTGHHPD